MSSQGGASAGSNGQASQARNRPQQPPAAPTDNQAHECAYHSRILQEEGQQPFDTSQQRQGQQLPMEKFMSLNASEQPSLLARPDNGDLLSLSRDCSCIDALGEDEELDI